MKTNSQCFKKYVTQKNRYSCGAIAIINLFKKIDKEKFFLKDVDKLNKKIKTDPTEGTEDVNVVKFLKQKGYIARSVDEIRLSGLKKYLKNGYEIIATIENEFYCHYSTIVGFDENGVFFSNCFTWKDMQKDHQSIKLLKKTAYYTNEQLRQVCYSKNNSLSIIFVRKP